MDAISAGAIVRLVVSVAVIVVALLAVKRWADRSGGRTRSGVRVVARVPVARGASVALVEVGSRHYLVGAGEHGVTLIDRLEGDDIAALTADEEPVDERRRVVEGAEPPRPGALAFSPAPGATPAPANGGLAFTDVTSGGNVGPRIGPLERLRRMTLRAPGRVRSGGVGG